MIFGILHSKITFVLDRCSLCLKMFLVDNNLRFKATYVFLD